MRNFDYFSIDEFAELEEILESYDSLEDLLETIIDSINSEEDSNVD